MATLLILTVGGSPEPVVHSLLEAPRADRVVFVCSEASLGSITAPPAEPQTSERSCPICGQSIHECRVSTGILARAESRGFAIGPGQYDRVVVRDQQQITSCIEDFEHRLTPLVQDWRSRGDTYEVIVDATGGTKCVSMALALVARRWPCTMRYIGGTARTKEGVGTVIDKHESSISCINPLEALGYQLIEDALNLARRMSFESARQMLTPANPWIQPQAKSRVATLQKLLGFFADWDRFDHAASLRALPDLEKNLSVLQVVLSDDSWRSVNKSIPAWRETLNSVAETTSDPSHPQGAERFPTRKLVEDLLGNANRRRIEGRYDDATARLYRAVEALAQWVLYEQYGIQTGHVLPSQLPAGFQDPLLTGPQKLGLQEAYQLLLAKGHPAGSAFVEAKLNAYEKDSKSPLIARNNSILAHGFAPMTPNAFAALWKAIGKLTPCVGIDMDKLLQFPVLTARVTSS